MESNKKPKIVKSTKEYCNNCTLPSETSNLRLLRVFITDVCNQDCVYCRVMKFSKGKHMDVDIFKKALQVFLENSWNKIKIVHFTGGEPLVNWKNLVSSIKLATTFDVKIVLGTNSSLISLSKAKFLKAMGVYVIISLDGDEQRNTLRVDMNGRNTFNKTLKGIEILKKLKVPIGISMTVSKININSLNDQIAWIINRFEPLSIGTNFLKPAYSDVNYAVSPESFVKSVYGAWKKIRWLSNPPFMEFVGRKLFPFITGVPRRYDCGASTGTTLNVTPNGMIGPCKTLALTGEVIGSHLEVLKILEKRSPFFIPECQNCSAINICGNGCAFNAKRLTKNIMNIDPEGCRISKTFYKEFRKDLKFLKNKKIKMLGNLKLNPDNPLHYSIGHFSDLIFR